MLEPDAIYPSDEEIAMMTTDEQHRWSRFYHREMQRVDPVRWGREKLRETWWSKQREIAMAVQRYRRVAVRSCHDVGKSFIAARVVAHWLDTHAPGEAFAVTSAPTFSQVRGILWREIGQAHRKGNLAGRINLTEWFIGPEIVGFGRKPSDTDPTAFQGIHAKYVLVVLDEACGIPQALWDAASTLATNDASRILAIGNPDDPASFFANVCKDDSLWHVIGISAYDSPNFTGELVPQTMRDVLISPTWVEEKKSEWGENSPIYVAKVLGQFPTDNVDGIVPYSWAQRCRRLPDNPAFNVSDPIELGVDVGGGGDETVIRERRGMKAGRVWKSRHDDAMRAVGEVVQAQRESGATAIKVDVIGVGFGMAGRLRELESEGTIKAKVVGVNVGERSSQPDRFKNLKAEIWWDVCRELSRSSGWDLAEVDDATVAELTAHKYKHDSSGRIQVEAKDDVRARLGRSPDNADALALAFYSPIERGPIFLGAA